MNMYNIMNIDEEKNKPNENKLSLNQQTSKPTLNFFARDILH